MKKNNIIAVVRFNEINTSLDFSDACIDGGIEMLEVITIKKKSYEVISHLSGRKDITVGAGTVMSLDSAKQAISAGAEFIVSPHTDREIIEYTKSEGKVSVAGAFTSSEIVHAHNLGADYVKIFPASVGGPGYIKAIKEALPFVNIFVTGGITLQNAKDYFTSGASILGVSTALNGSADKMDKQKVIDSSKGFAALLKELKGR